MHKHASPGLIPLCTHALPLLVDLRLRCLNGTSEELRNLIDSMLQAKVGTVLTAYTHHRH